MFTPGLASSMLPILMLHPAAAAALGTKRGAEADAEVAADALMGMQTTPALIEQPSLLCSPACKKLRD